MISNEKKIKIKINRIECDKINGIAINSDIKLFICGLHPTPYPFIDIQIINSIYINFDQTKNAKGKC